MLNSGQKAPPWKYSVPKIALEAGTTLGWHKYVGTNGLVIGVNQFGKSAPGKIIYEKFGFNVDNIVKKSIELIKKSDKR